MKAFENTVVSKPELVEVLEYHQLADNFIKGQYWGNGQGCGVGCSLENFTDKPNSHSEYERLFGIPRIIAILEDGIFEGLSNEDAKWWPLAFAKSIPVGADLSMIWPKFAIWLLADEKEGVIRHVKTDKSKESIMDIVALYKREVDGEEFDVYEWVKARRAANANADDADDASYAYAYAGAKAADAGYVYAAASTNYVYADNDTGHAYAYADAAADDASYAYAYADKQKSRKKQADKLIELFKSCA